jgi:predicted metal-dependent peptidase
MDIIMPSLISERVGHIVYGADMSGSVGNREQTLMVTELLHLANEVRPDKIDVLYWDSHVARHEEYDESNMDLIATSTKPTGGGGTSPACVKRYLTEKRIEPECVIMLTDGYVDSWPTFDCPTLWVVTTKGITAPTGITIHLNDA